MDKSRKSALWRLGLKLGRRDTERLGGGRADYVARELRRGSRVLVRGRLEIGEWTTRDGEHRTSYDIWADDVVNLRPREDGPRGQGEPLTTSAPKGRPLQAATPTAAGRGQDEDLDELPF